jgi:hypothetical protein
MDLFPASGDAKESRILPGLLEELNLSTESIVYECYCHSQNTSVKEPTDSVYYISESEHFHHWVL